MVPKSLVPTTFAVVLLVSGSASAADYRAGDFFALDLATAIFSKAPLGPPTEFAPTPVEAKGDHGSEPAWARNDLKVKPRQVPTRTVTAAQPHRAAHVAFARPHGIARVRLAHRHHGDPMNAQARDTRIQTWPCRSGGGICDWKR
jgi:hypothetical protein